MIDSEKIWRIWNRNGDSCIEVGEDPDGLGLVELRQRDPETGKIGDRVTLRVEEAERAAEHMVDIVNWLRTRKEND